MFFLNTYRWDFPQVAALVAPRPLLIGNSDKDNLFPLDGVVRLYNETRRIYHLYGKTNQLGLLITEGPHADTQDLQLPVFRWFNRFLKGQSPLIEMAARDFFPPEQLRVFDKLPEDQVNTTIDESFVPKATPPGPLASPAEAKQRQEEYRTALRAKVFAGWPEEHGPTKPELSSQATQGGVRLRTYTFSSQPGVNLILFVLQDPKVKRPAGGPPDGARRRELDNSPAKQLWLGGGSPEEPKRHAAADAVPQARPGVLRPARRRAEQITK